MKLKKLLKNISVDQVKGSKEIEITGICSNSKLASPGNLFVAKKGNHMDGSRFIPEAVDAGAVAVLTDIYDPFLKNIVQVIHPNVPSIEGLLAANYYEFPSDELFTVGITGTSGKTTTTMLVKYLLDKVGCLSGLIGTIEYIVGSHRYEAKHTTPDVILNHKMLREMILQGCKAVSMEVSSHGLIQGRTEHVHFDVAVFTNLSSEHLDYHLTMDSYCDAKSLLFDKLIKTERKSPIAIVNGDDPWHQRIVKNCQVPVITFGMSPGVDLRAFDEELHSDKTSFKIAWKGEIVEMHWPLIGRFNIYNGLAAIAVGLVKKIPLQQIVEILSHAPVIRGRMEAVPNALGLNIIVDYAHKPDALRKVLECLKGASKGKIITVFGCGGDRDRQKRPQMAQAAEEFSDISIVTNDNPRTENPLSICEEILAGYKNTNHYLVELDRRQAIKKALEIAVPGDTVLIAGKGHETTQTFVHQTIVFDDRLVAMELCNELSNLCIHDET